MTTNETVSDLTGYRTTFHDMFVRDVEGTPRVSAVEIPLIQRDYAQGRDDARTNAIRGTFLDALHGALTGNTSVGLDFIYGEVQEDGTFEPLDGQQRLTTLFLLHWYVATRREDLANTQQWTSFTYATRPSARRFCERIVENPPPPDHAGPPSSWIVDQSWYLHLWSFDPSIRAMLVTLDAIADRFASEDPDALWARLTNREEPAIWFQLLPIDEMGAAEDLYIKMNSRGKPLTEFEAFKALLGQLVEDVDGYDDFGHRVDGAWTDLLWPYRGDNNIVDDEFMRYLDFLMEVCEWRDGQSGDPQVVTPEQRIRALLGPTNPRHREHLYFIYEALEGWVRGDVTIEAFLGDLFTTVSDGERVRLFGANATSNLFLACCERYGDTSGSTRLFSLTDTLLLFAVLVGKDLDTANLRTRLRVLRNVNEASQFEMRVTNMPKFIGEVEEFMRSGDIARLVTFNTNQVNEERAKRTLLAESPELEQSIARLEDHPILRGTLASFDLDSMIGVRAATFESVFAPNLWPLLTGALLAAGEYQRGYLNSDQFRFGSPTTDSVWRLMLVDRGDRESLAPVRTALAHLLDLVGAPTNNVRDALERISADFAANRQSIGQFDWRYYLVMYPEMREGNSGIYYGADQRLGYEMTMLRRKVQNSYFRDAYLFAIWSRAGEPNEIEDPWFYGYSTTPRWMVTTESRVGVRSVPTGFEVQMPLASPDRERFAAFAEAESLLNTDSGWLLAVPQTNRNGQLIDSVDRVRIGASFLTRLIAGRF